MDNLLFIVLTLCSLCSLTFAQLNCTVPLVGEPSLMTYATAYKCLTSLPLLPDVMQNELEVLEKSLELYAFRDININSPPSDGLIHVQTDLETALKQIGKQTFSSDMEFHETLQALFVGLKDAHTMYRKSQRCYGINVMQPFILSSELQNKSQIITIKDVKQDIGHYWESQYGMNFTSFIGKRVLKIDGEEALQHIINWAMKYDYRSKDIGSLFNYALWTHFTTRDLTRTPFPKSETVKYEFEGGASINVPFLMVPSIYAPIPVTINETCIKNTDHSDQSSSQQLNRDELLHGPFHPSVNPPVVHEPSAKVSRLLPLWNISSVATFVYSTQVLVIRIYDFVPLSDEQFLDIIFKTIEFGQIFSVPYLIFDLRSNGGGDICLGYQVINAVMEESNPYGRYDVIHSPLMDELMTALAENAGMFFSPGTLVNPETNQPYTNISWYLPGKTYVRGGVAGKYSNFEHLACDNVTAPIQYLFKKILIVTDGLCGSTCAVFSSHLAEADHIETVVVGGIYNRTEEQQYFSFPGGEVFDAGADLDELIEELNITANVPPHLMTDAVISFTLQEIYSWNDTDPLVPLEFLYKPADHHIYQWSFTSDEQLYSLVTPFFN